MHTVTDTQPVTAPCREVGFRHTEVIQRVGPASAAVAYK